MGRGKIDVLLKMIPDFFQNPELVTNISFWKTILGLSLVLFATFVGVEVRFDNEDDER